VELVRAIFETFRRDTWESGEWLARYDPDVVYHPREDEPDTKPCVGREAWGQIVDGFMEAFAEITFDVEETFDADDWAIVSTVLHGRGGGSGVEVNDHYVFVYKVRDGLVVEGWSFNTMEQAFGFIDGLAE
jgi:ketosteroid isomerase-like protein